jgi:hypothetical protein
MGKVAKRDFRKELKHLYGPSAKTVEVVEVPEFQFAMVDGELEPETPPGESAVFHNALQALYGISFTLKFMSKLRKENPIDYGVMALEGLWDLDAKGGIKGEGGAGKEFDFDQSRPWRFTLMILQPDHITRAMYKEALAKLKDKKDNPSLEILRLDTFREGLCVQTLHVGPYDQQQETMARMQAFAEAEGLSFHGRHHEIYLGDPRRSKPERLKTILRHPVRK